MTVFAGGQVAQEFLESQFVVLEHPPICRFADIVEAREQVLVQNFFPEGPVRYGGLFPEPAFAPVAGWWADRGSGAAVLKPNTLFAAQAAITGRKGPR